MRRISPMLRRVRSRGCNWATGFGGMAATITQDYTYDGVNRLLLAAEYTNGTATPSCPDTTSQWCTQFGYDAYGNRSVANATNYSFVNQPVTFSPTTNQVTGSGWNYDTVNGRGTVTSDPGGDSFTYDAEDRLLTANGMTYRYDGDGRRVGNVPAAGISSATWYVYDASGELAAEYGGTVAALGTSYLTGDHLGSTRVVTGSSAAVGERHDFYPFGAEILTSAGGPRYQVAGYAPAVETAWLFSGKERDSETGLDYFGARYMSSAQGRFTSPDPATSSAKLDDPQTWNRYAYVTNNPLRYVDSDGRDRLEAAQDAAVRDYVAGRITRQQLADRTIHTAPAGVGAVGAGVMIAATAVAALPEELAGAAALGLYNLATRFFNSPGGQETLESTGQMITGTEGPPSPGLRSAASAEQATIRVIGHFPEYVDQAESLGARYFSIPEKVWNSLSPDAQWAANQKYLDRAIGQGAEFVLATPRDKIRSGSYLQREVKYLLSNGYEWAKDNSRLVRADQ